MEEFIHLRDKEKNLKESERDQRRESEVRGDRKGDSEQWCQTEEHWSSDGCCPLTIRAFEGEGEEVLHVGSARARTSQCQPPPQRQMTEPLHFYMCTTQKRTAEVQTHVHSQYCVVCTVSSA